MNLIWLFIILNVVNVIIQTVKSIATIKCGKTMAALVNAIAYGLYTVVVVYTVCDLSLWFKVAVVAIANLVGVYVVKLIEEKGRKDKLWKIEASVPNQYTMSLHKCLKINSIPHNFIENVGEYTVFNIYCATQNESVIVKELLNTCEAKYFVSESKIL